MLLLRVSVGKSLAEKNMVEGFVGLMFIVSVFCMAV